MGSGGTRAPAPRLLAPARAPLSLLSRNASCTSVQAFPAGADGSVKLQPNVFWNEPLRGGCIYRQYGYSALVRVLEVFKLL